VVYLRKAAPRFHAIEKEAIPSGARSRNLGEDFLADLRKSKVLFSRAEQSTGHCGDKECAKSALLADTSLDSATIPS
jgi:hypothetical protein